VAGWAHLAGALVAVDLVELTPPPASDDLDALAEAAARRERARHRTGRADTARTPPQRDLTGWGAAVAAVWTAELDGAPLPADRQATAADAARMVAAARIAWDRVGPPPADPAAPPDVADLAERLLGRHGRAAGWPDATTAQWQAWLRAQLGEGVQRG